MNTKPDASDLTTATTRYRHRDKLLAGSSLSAEPKRDDTGLVTPVTRRRIRAALVAGSTLPAQLARLRLVSQTEAAALVSLSRSSGGGCGRRVWRPRPCGSVPIGWRGASGPSSTGPTSGPSSSRSSRPRRADDARKHEGREPSLRARAQRPDTGLRATRRAVGRHVNPFPADRTRRPPARPPAQPCATVRDNRGTQMLQPTQHSAGKSVRAIDPLDEVDALWESLGDDAAQVGDVNTVPAREPGSEDPPARGRSPGTAPTPASSSRLTRARPWRAAGQRRAACSRSAS